MDCNRQPLSWDVPHLDQTSRMKRKNVWKDIKQKSYFNFNTNETFRWQFKKLVHLIYFLRVFIQTNSKYKFYFQLWQNEFYLNPTLWSKVSVKVLISWILKCKSEYVEAFLLLSTFTYNDHLRVGSTQLFCWNVSKKQTYFYIKWF